MERKTFDDYYLDIAKSVAKRSSCLRRQYGAVIVKNNRIISTGYNGAARGVTECCKEGKCIRSELGVKHGERYELCKSVHAEANAIIQGTASEMEGATLYLAGLENGKTIRAVPCMMCRRMILNAKLHKIVARVQENETFTNFTTFVKNLKIKENEDYKKIFDKYK